MGADQPQVLRGRGGDVTVNRHSSGGERPLTCLVRQHEGLWVRPLGQSLRALGHWHLQEDARESPA